VGSLAPVDDGLPPVLVLLAIYALTSLLTELVTNNAVAVILTPIAIALGLALGSIRAAGGGGDDRRLGLLRDAHRLPDQHAGLRPGRLPLHRLPAVGIPLNVLMAQQKTSRFCTKATSAVAVLHRTGC
jgi:hypothetical protein